VGNLEDRWRHSHVTTPNEYLTTQALLLHLTTSVKNHFELRRLKC
jgi:hypothetical protein